MNVTIEELKNILQFPVHIKETEVPASLPFYMARRGVFCVKVDDFEFILIELNDNESFNINALKKQLETYSDTFNRKCGFIIKNPVRNQINAFLRNLVPFVTTSKQIFLPFMGIMLSEIEKKEKKINTDFMMPATQLMFLYMFYNSDEIYFTKSAIASKLGVSKTSMTRGADQLSRMGLITETKYKRESRMKLVAKGNELYIKAKDFLISPLFSEFYVNKDKMAKEYLISGETALAEISMLAPPKIPCYAVFKNDESIKDLEQIDIRWDNVSNPALIQLWKYPPEVFSNENRVDSIS